MPKLTKQQKILYSFVAVAVLLSAIWLNLPQTSPMATHHTVVRMSTPAAVADDPADDTNVHFARYIGSARDPFVPGVAITSGLDSASGKLAATGKWQLTGINSVDGVTSALVENSATNASVFLKVGDSWNGLRVASIGDDTVDFVNALGQPSQLGFAAPPDPLLAINGGTDNESPSVNQVTPLPPLSPQAASGAAPTYFGRRGQ